MNIEKTKCLLVKIYELLKEIEIENILEAKQHLVELINARLIHHIQI